MYARVPDDTLEDDDLHHEGLSESAIHGVEEGDAHDQGVRKSRNREQGDEPVEGWAAEEEEGEGEEEEDEELGECVGEDELGVHLVWVVLGYEVERQHRHREHRHEAVDPGALRRREHVAPLHRPVRHQHGEVEWHHCAHHLVQILSCYHYYDLPPPPPPSSSFSLHDVSDLSLSLSQRRCELIPD